MNVNLLIKGINGIIPDGVSIKDFAVITRMDENKAKEILDILIQNEIGEINGELINFEDGDKLKAAIFAINNGATIEKVSQYIDWKDFEGLVAKILDSKNFDVSQNFRMKNPTMEIDVIGMRFGIAILIDCKHWKRMSHSTLEVIVRKQIERVKHYVSSTSDVIAVPVIVTLYQEETSFINKVPIVPILKFSSFIDDFYGRLDEIKTIEK